MIGCPSFVHMQKALRMSVYGILCLECNVLLLFHSTFGVFYFRLYTFFWPSDHVLHACFLLKAYQAFFAA